MELSVPYVRQPEESVWCGPASAAMVLKFYGRRVSLQRVVRELNIKSSRGVTNAHLASYLLGQGMEVTVQGWPEGMANNLCSKEVLKGKTAIDMLRMGAQNGTTKKARVFCKELVALAKRGGDIFLGPVTVDDFRKNLESGGLIIASVDLKSWAGVSRKMGHYVVIYGVTDRDSKASQPCVHLHDPLIVPGMFITVKEILRVCNSWFGSVIYVSQKAVQ
ncbi:MAG TPA: C39 family peptidase [Candidatus Paceibacterota bacterium]